MPIKRNATAMEDDMANDLHYLERLAEQYPTISKASAEIINLQSVLEIGRASCRERV